MWWGCCTSATPFGTDQLYTKLLLFLIHISDHKAFKSSNTYRAALLKAGGRDEEKGGDEFSLKSHFPSSPLVSKILLYS